MAQWTLVVGLGKTGCSIARYLTHQGEAFKAFDTRDASESIDAFRAAFPDIDIYLGDETQVPLDEVLRIVCSPGVPLDCGLLKAARQRNILIESDIDCFAKAVSAPVVAITGTNGKSTVTALLGEMAKASERAVCVAGNIGKPVLDCLLDEADIDLWVLELSSFQLERTHALKPLAAAFLNLSDDHLDMHYDMAAYCTAKQRVYRDAKILLFNRNDSATYPVEKYITKNARLVSYGNDASDADDKAWSIQKNEKGALWLAMGQQLLLPVAELSMQGMHNALNALAALALSYEIGLSQSASISVLKQFQGLPHRCQTVRELNGVRWINDSKGTNVGSTVSAIRGLGPLLSGKLILIAGGKGKGADFRVLREALKAHVRVLILIGEDAPLLAEALSDLAEIFYAKSMEEAVLFAKQKALSGDAVLLSPACASFDWFQDFNHRGEVFTALVEAL